MKTRWTITLVLVVLCGMAQASVVFSFALFTTNGVNNNRAGLNLWAEVYNGNGTATNATFKFHNDSWFTCCITQIYFDDGSLLGIGSLVNGPGTLYGSDAVTPGPGNLPAGNNLTPPFSADREFSIAPFAPVTPDGISPGEWVSVTFNLDSGGTLQDVLNELASGDLRVGIHIQAFPDGKSESAIMIPEPATATLLGVSGMFVWFGRRKLGRDAGTKVTPKKMRKVDLLHR